MPTWDTFWDIVEKVILPAIGVLWWIFWEKLKKYDTEIEKLKEEHSKLRTEMARLEAGMVTREDMDEILQQFESRIDKTIALNLKPLSDLLNRFMDNVSMQMAAEGRRTQGRAK